MIGAALPACDASMSTFSIANQFFLERSTIFFITLARKMKVSENVNCY
ncbi:hypothetical protein H206_11932 [Candidatus Electrothrix aarhusensis]|uniref:Uncharacterized protein n=1 Tax=Candidatus Electrothrix aarhusensis TaxID=1859131 RepID=A0A444J1X6_9BACT|nr:hypothetical protein H206_11932 [Candidatus Electrothrix aarhusensis]